jgi:ATP-dependent 26S proteasome regulatory subunit
MPDEEKRLLLWKKNWNVDYIMSSDISIEALAKDFEFSPAQIRNIIERSILFAVKNKQNFIEKADLGVSILRELDKESAGFLADKKLSDWLTSL